MQKYFWISRQNATKLFKRVTIMKMNDNMFSRAVLPASRVGLGFSSTCLVALRAFLVSVEGAKKAHSEILNV